MMGAEAQVVAFLVALMGAGVKGRMSASEGLVRTVKGCVRLDKEHCMLLAAAGIVCIDGQEILPTRRTKLWLRRHKPNSYDPRSAGNATYRNRLGILADTPLARLIESGNGEPYLDAHHIAAALRLRGLFERAALRQRVTMSYDPTRTARQKGGAGTADMPATIADARATFTQLCRNLPADCRSVLLDICCFEKGLQAVEAERLWPRRSAKLVLRIGLEQLANSMGLVPVATGVPSEIARVWMDVDARPDSFA